ncbi:MAG: hypothetical protein K2L27_04135 [Muribaculaceae bacterium]|nr:hypothetical protein [Muribaculaceae bacterium]
MTTNFSPKQLEIIAHKVAEKLMESQDEMWPLERLHKEKGFSKSYIYHNADILGGVKAGGKWFFSKRNIEALIKSGQL